LLKNDQKKNFSIFLKNLIFGMLSFKNGLGCVPRPEKRENSLKIGQFLPILATFYEFKSPWAKGQNWPKLTDFQTFWS
jgi:hypothetical protein